MERKKKDRKENSCEGEDINQGGLIKVLSYRQQVKQKTKEMKRK